MEVMRMTKAKTVKSMVEFIRYMDKESYFKCMAKYEVESRKHYHGVGAIEAVAIAIENEYGAAFECNWYSVAFNFFA
jgi:hypothetical protein